MTFNCCVHHRICCSATFFPLQILLDFLWIPSHTFCFVFFFLLFGWVLLIWIPAGTTPDAHFVFMDTCLLQRTLGIFWDPLSKALTSCHRRVSVLQPISFPTSRHRSSPAICYKTAARCTLPTKGKRSGAEKFFPLFFFFLFNIKVCAESLRQRPSICLRIRPADRIFWDLFWRMLTLSFGHTKHILDPNEQSQKRNLVHPEHPNSELLCSHHWMFGLITLCFSFLLSTREQCQCSFTHLC